MVSLPNSPGTLGQKSGLDCPRACLLPLLVLRRLVIAVCTALNICLHCFFLLCCCFAPIATAVPCFACLPIRIVSYSDLILPAVPLLCPIATAVPCPPAHPRLHSCGSASPSQPRWLSPPPLAGAVRHGLRVQGCTFSARRILYTLLRV